MQFYINDTTRDLIADIQNNRMPDCYIDGDVLHLDGLRSHDIYFKLLMDSLCTTKLRMCDTHCPHSTFVGVDDVVMSSCDFNSSDFRNVDFYNWAINNSGLSNGLFLGGKNLHAYWSSFQHGMMRGMTFIKDLEGCSMNGAMMLDCDFTQCNVIDTSFAVDDGTHAYLQNAVFDTDKCDNCDFNGAFLYEATVGGAWCSYKNATLIGATINVDNDYTMAYYWEGANIQLAKFRDPIAEKLALITARTTLTIK